LPLISESFPDTEMFGILGAIASSHGITYQRLKAAGCQGITVRPWRSCPHNAGRQVRKILYMPLQAKKRVQAATVQRLYCGEGDVTLVEQAYTPDVAHMVQSVWHFSRSAGGGVDMRLWVDAVWKDDQPKTHLAFGAFVEKGRAESWSRSNAIACRAECWRIIQTAAREYCESSAADAMRAPWQSTQTCLGKEHEVVQEGHEMWETMGAPEGHPPCGSSPSTGPPEGRPPSGSPTTTSSSISYPPPPTSCASSRCGSG
jgi:hypothetical protein